MPTIKGERTRVMHALATQLKERGYSTVQLRKRNLVFSRDRGVVQQNINIYFLSHKHSHGKAYLGSPHGSIECPEINRLIMKSLDMRRFRFSNGLHPLPRFDWSTSSTFYSGQWLVAGHIQDVPPITPAIVEIERYFDSHLTIQSILAELITQPFAYHTIHVAMHALAAAVLAQRKDLFDELIQKIKTSNIYYQYHPVSLLVEKLRRHF